MSYPSSSSSAAAGATSAPVTVADGVVTITQPDTVCILIVGTAGSGKTTLVHRLGVELAMRGHGTYLVNLDPAVQHLPYSPSIDIRDTVNYKELMKKFSLGPNGAIVTALNLFSTRFDKVVDLLKARAPTTKYVIVDTPGQIEVFTWSASGSLITDMLASAFPTIMLYVIDTPRCRSPVTFMSNMLYACSILYKTRLPFALAFNKTDVVSSDFATKWMEDFESFQTALDEASARSDAYINSLTRSLSLALDEFYSTLREVGVSSVTGEGFPELLGAIDDAAREYNEDILPELQAAHRVRGIKEAEQREADIARLRTDVFGSEAAEAAAAAAEARGAADEEEGEEEEGEDA